MEEKMKLLAHIDEIHTTEMGVERIKKNLKIYVTDVAKYCRNLISNKSCKIYKQGKNFYCEVDSVRLTINSYSLTIITAHRM